MEMYVVVTHYNHLSEAILSSIHSKPFDKDIEKIPFDDVFSPPYVVEYKIKTGIVEEFSLNLLALFIDKILGLAYDLWTSKQKKKQTRKCPMVL